MTHYRAIADTCEKMLEAARHDDWAAVARLESATRSRIEAIRANRGLEPLTPAQRREKYRVLRRILAIDLQLCQLRDPRQQEVDRLLYRIASRPFDSDTGSY